MSPLGVLLGAALALVLLALVASCLLRANRLDRLHVRTDAARAALLAALERRAVVARAVALHRIDEPLRACASRAEAAAPVDRETAENELSSLLGELDRDALPAELRAELADAEQRVMIARRVHNDAVRDTLALRSRRLVRWLRLAGTAPAPGYFEIVDVDPAAEDPVVIEPTPRRTGRVLLFDADGRLLLLEGVDPARPQEPFWYTPGGGAEPGEDSRAAALRELAEGTGVRLSESELVGPVWRRRALFSSAGQSVAAEEEFFLATSPAVCVDAANGPVGTVIGRRWWSGHELRGTDAVVFPRELGVLLGELSPDKWDGVTRQVS